MKSITLLAGIAALSVLSAAAAHADSLPKEMIGGWCPSELGGGYYARNTDGRDFGQKRKSSRPAHQFALPLKATKARISMASVATGAHFRRNPRRRKERAVAAGNV